MSGGRTSIFPTYHITHFHPLYITLSLVSKIISFLTSSYCASGCHCLLWLVSVCHPMLTLAKHPTTTAPKKSNLHSLKQTQNTFMFLASLVQCMHLSRFKKQFHLPQIAPISFILLQLCAHDAFKSHQTTFHRVVRMLFSVFALAVDRFVTIRRRTAQFCFGLLMCCLFLGSPPSPP